MHYVNVLGYFKANYYAYVLLNKQTSPEVPLVSDKDKEKKIINWVPLIEDALSHTFGSNSTLVYIVRENDDVPDVGDNHLTANAYYGASRSMLEEPMNSLPHAGPIFRGDNKTVFMMNDKAVYGTSMESKIKSYSRRKDGCAKSLALIANHTGDTKYRAIIKSRSNLLQNIKCNVRNNPLEKHVSNNCTAI